MHGKLLKVYITIFMGLFLAGCASKNYYHTIQEIPYDEYQANILAGKLTQQGIKIIQTSADVTIIIPAKMLFISNTANFADSVYHVLDDVASYLKCFETETMEIAYFAKVRNVNDQRILGAIILRRAQNVGQFLWRQHVNAQFVYADGYEKSTMQHGKIVLSDCIVINFQKA
jgi:hypothetical protein